ncbi:MAG: PAS domain S-box protein, partial [Holophagales bacterium]|nr:PAS domain S-box protein [Holophagales bacterium]
MLASLLAGGAEPTAAQEPSGQFSGSAWVLDGEWLLSTDDGPGAATGKTGEWREVQLPADWKALGLLGYEGPVWLRRSLELPAEVLTDSDRPFPDNASPVGGAPTEALPLTSSGVSIFVGPLDGGWYRVWADGEPVGSHGELWKLPTPRPRVFPVPARALRDQEVQVSIRLERVAWRADEQTGAVAPFSEILIGPDALLEQRRQLQELQSEKRARGGQIMASLLLAVGLFQLFLYYRRRPAERQSRQGYLWLGLNSLDFAAATWLYAPHAALGDAWPLEQRLVKMLLHLSVPPFILFFWPFLGRKLTGWPLFYLRSQIALALLVGILPLEWVFLSEPVRWLWLAPFFLVLIQTAARDALSGAKDAKYMAVGSSVMIVAGVAEGILQTAGLGTSDPLPAAAFGVFLLCLLMAASQRYERNTDELLTLRQQLERMVDDRTTELSAANERLQAEIAERQLAEGAMRMLERAVEQSIDGIMVADLEENSLFVNEAWARLHGRETYEIFGRRLDLFHSSDQMGDLRPALDQVRKDGSWEGEISHRRKDGSEFPTWTSITLLRDPEAEPVGFVMVARDISERKQAAEERERIEDRIQEVEKLRSLADLAGGIAHDYNNMLTGVLGNSSLALRELPAES